ncbi:MAG: hypothetical protein K2K06_06540 [Oscillospiraceae bacterium]|nr:hypothetical protein [Ruminococcus sp.]MDE6707675.1 hypothetical protein [Oscillospiraceae bacterium]
MNVDIYAKEEMQKIIANQFPKNTVVISFYDKRKSKNYSYINYDSVCQDVFYCEIDDLDLKVLEYYGYTYDTYFPEADKLAEFIYHAYQNHKNIICQCDYGQSRSAGCASAILEHFYHTGISVFADYRRSPNQVVYHKVFDALEKYKKNIS